MTDERGVPSKFFHEIYAAATPPPWQTGRPQPDVQSWWDLGLFQGEVLDAGCGTGENAIWLAERGLRVHGFDLVPAAIEAAKRKAIGRGLPVQFEVRDGLTLATLGRQFDTVLDSGLFHIFSDADRPSYVAGLRAVTRLGGRLFLLCFSGEETSEIGPRRLHADELRACFAQGWTLESLEPSRYESLAHPGGARAWRVVCRAGRRLVVGLGRVPRACHRSEFSARYAGVLSRQPGGSGSMASKEVWTLGKLLEWTAKYLAEHGSEFPRLDAEVLLAHAQGCQRIHLYTRFEEAASEEVRARFKELVRKRVDGCPVAYLVGQKEFYSMVFEVNPAVLIPRPDTEILVLEALRLAKPMPAPTLLDVGTGSGAIAIALARNHPGLRCTAVDLSDEAIAVARRNAKRHQVDDRIDFVQGDLFSPLPSSQRFDFIVSNPPTFPRIPCRSCPWGFGISSRSWHSTAAREALK